MEYERSRSRRVVSPWATTIAGLGVGVAIAGLLFGSGLCSPAMSADVRDTRIGHLETRVLSVEGEQKVQANEQHQIQRKLDVLKQDIHYMSKGETVDKNWPRDIEP